jgi:hypothetical protein
MKEAAMDNEQAALGRIVALLHALAAIADLVAARPGVRGFVIWLLRRAERAARDFVDVDPDVADIGIAMGPAANSAADAMYLAASLRALACQLDAQARWLGVAPFRAGGGRPPKPPVAPMTARLPALRDALAAISAFAFHAPHPAPDTS